MKLPSILMLVSSLVVAHLAAAADQPILLRGTLVTMESEGDVVREGALLIQDGVIQEILYGNRPSPVEASIVLDTQGLIFPGLINLHDHHQFSPIQALSPEALYQNRYEWQADGDGVDLTPFLGVNPPLAFNRGSSPFNADALYPMHLLTDPVLGGLGIEAAKWGELQGLVGGTTTTEGSIPSSAVTGVLARNAEHTNFGRDRVCRTTLAVTDPGFAAFAADALSRAAAGELDACLIHLAEGVDAASKAELDALEALGMLQPWTVVVHGTAFGVPELERLATAGADLVWSPTSNLVLYGDDARADLAVDLGINVSLGTDWVLTGDRNLLASLKIAWALNQERHRTRDAHSPPYRRFSSYQLLQMVTTNPARSLGWEDRVGRLRPGLAADLLVIEGSADDLEDPYRALIDAHESDVRLVMVGGDALYGDLDLMATLKPGDHEPIAGPGFVKAVDTTKPGVPKGWQTAQDLRSTLETAMVFDLPTMYGEFPVVPIIESIVGQPVSLPQFAYLFGLVFFDYLPPGTPFPPSPAALGSLFAPGALSHPLGPLYP